MFGNLCDPDLADAPGYGLCLGRSQYNDSCARIARIRAYTNAYPVVGPQRDFAMCLGVPGQVIDTFREDDMLMGKVDFGGVVKKACLEHVPDVRIGEFVLVHVGFALSRIDAEEARRVLDFLTEIGQLDELAEPSP